MRRIVPVLIIGLVLALVAGCTALPGAPAGAGLTVVEPFARASPMEGGMAGAFMTIKNAGATADRLAAAAFTGSKTVELHETVDDNGVMKMRPHPEGWEVPAGGELVLQPGGKHVMLIGLNAPLKVDTQIELTLTFEKAGPIKVMVPVRAP